MFFLVGWVLRKDGGDNQGISEKERVRVQARVRIERSSGEREPGCEYGS